MRYFQVSQASAHYFPEWDAVVRQIEKWPPVYFEERLDQYRLYRDPPDQGIEAKALYIFTVARRLIRSAWQLAGVNAYRWHLIFIETTSLLFPMIELVGEARKAAGNHELGAGIRWLQSPQSIPATSDPMNDTSPINPVAQLMPGRPAPRVCDLYYLRNYYLHGPRRINSPVPIADIINADLPLAIIQQAESAMRAYWNQLRQDDGTDSGRDWVMRLANADVRPFVIQGSEIFEAGLVDPNIVDYLEDWNATVCQ